MKKIFYEKVGRKYIPIKEYNSEFIDGFTEGAHLIMCYPNGSSRVYNIDPDYASMIAAGRVAKDIITKKIVEASQLQPTKKMLSIEQKLAWDNLAKELGDDLATLQVSSAYDIAGAGINAMIEEANKLLNNPSVRKAYDQFQLVCELTKENHEFKG